MAENEGTQPKQDSPEAEPSAGASAPISLDALVSENAPVRSVQADSAARTETAMSQGQTRNPASDPSNSVAGAPVPAGESSSGSHGDAGSPTSQRKDGPAVDTTIAIDQVDRVLTLEDPAFVASLGEIRDIGVDAHAGEAALDTGDVTSPDPVDPHSFAAVLLARKQGPKAFSRAFVLFVIHSFKHSLNSTIALIKGQVAAFAALATLSKLMVVGVFVLVGVLSQILRLGFFVGSARSLRLPKIEANFLSEFGTLADHAYEYGESSQMLNFQDPMLHPENVILIEHIVVNLHPSPQHGNPMALADFYIEAASRDAAVEIKEREVEVRDSMSRTLEQISYEDITTEPGKYKLKVILRKNLNEFMTSGRVRKLYFKSLVLKP